VSGLSRLSTVTFTVDGQVATVTLNRPERLNSFNHTMVSEFDQIWHEVRDNDEIHAVVLRAAGERAFCTGIDVQEGAWWTDVSVFHQQDPGVILGPKAQQVWKPVVTAVHGMAAGGAFYFLNESDIIVCSEDATFFDPHASGGIVSALEPVGLLHRGVPLGDVLRWALLGSEERITAESALRLGIVTEIVSRETLWSHANQLATEIAQRRPLAVQGTVRAIWESLDLPASVGARMGTFYTLLGNETQPAKPPGTRTKPRFR
jgi:enoyl-CoA hydratase/carnithine racemase